MRMVIMMMKMMTSQMFWEGIHFPDDDNCNGYRWCNNAVGQWSWWWYEIWQTLRWGQARCSLGRCTPNRDHTLVPLMSGLIRNFSPPPVRSYLLNHAPVYIYVNHQKQQQGHFLSFHCNSGQLKQYNMWQANNAVEFPRKCDNIFWQQNISRC